MQFLQPLAVEEECWSSFDHLLPGDRNMKIRIKKLKGLWLMRVVSRRKHLAEVSGPEI